LEYSGIAAVSRAAVQHGIFLFADGNGYHRGLKNCHQRLLPIAQRMDFGGDNDKAFTGLYDLARGAQAVATARGKKVDFDLSRDDFHTVFHHAQGGITCGTVANGKGQGCMGCALLL
jgi:hypothetical protein